VSESTRLSTQRVVSRLLSLLLFGSTLPNATQSARTPETRSPCYSGSKCWAEVQMHHPNAASASLAATQTSASDMHDPNCARLRTLLRRTSHKNTPPSTQSVGAATLKGCNTCPMHPNRLAEPHAIPLSPPSLPLQRRPRARPNISTLPNPRHSRSEHSNNVILFVDHFTIIFSTRSDGSLFASWLQFLKHAKSICPPVRREPLSAATQSQTQQCNSPRHDHDSALLGRL
jgi:hypothetical protein